MKCLANPLGHGVARRPNNFYFCDDEVEEDVFRTKMEAI